MSPALGAEIGRALGAPLASARALGGGDINDAWAIALADGRVAFVKGNERAPVSMFAAEARGLAWLAAAGAIRVPAVLAVAERFLALELIEPAPRAGDHHVRLGRELAALHRSGAARFGLDHDNFIGRLPQANAPCDDWGEFYRSRRLEPQLRMAIDRGRASARLARDHARLLERLDERLGPPEPPARLHGDLWSGNRYTDERGRACLVDPAAYAGHREVDLAMMHLFGGFAAPTFDAYHEAFPLAAGWRERLPLYQLYFVMAHVNLFGGAYVGQAEAIVRRLV